MRYQPTTIRDNVLHDISEGVMVVDLNGIIALYNPACVSILSIPFEDAKEHPFASVFFKNPQLITLIQQAITGQKHDRFIEYNADSVQKHLCIRSAPLKEHGAIVGKIFVINDDTELLELKEDIQDVLKEKHKIEHKVDRLRGRNSMLAKTFAKYTSNGIVNEVLSMTDGTSFDGQRVHLSVLMSDLRGFSAISEHLDPKDLLRMLNHYFGEMLEITSKYKGTVIDFSGDGMMVLFGAPIKNENHAEAATAAAIAMQEKMADINLWNSSENLPLIEMGIGISTGDMVLGIIGSDRHAKYGVVGSSVNLCSRIESYTVGGEIYISPQTKDEIQVPLTIVKEKDILPKGKSIPLRISHVCALGNPYHVSCPGILEEPAPIQPNLDIQYTICNGKHCSIDTSFAKLTHLSRQAAIIESPTSQLNEMDELNLHINGELGCRVVKIEDSQYTLRFTSFPLDFDSWYQNIQKENQFST